LYVPSGEWSPHFSCSVSNAGHLACFPIPLSARMQSHQLLLMDNTHEVVDEVPGLLEIKHTRRPEVVLLSSSRALTRSMDPPSEAVHSTCPSFRVITVIVGFAATWSRLLWCGIVPDIQERRPTCVDRNAAVRAGRSLLLFHESPCARRDQAFFSCC